MSKFYMTKHAVERALERFGWDFNTLKSNAEEALREGIFLLHDDALGPLFYTCKDDGGMPYLSKGVVYIFVDDKLITVYNINGKGLYYMGALG